MNAGLSGRNATAEGRGRVIRVISSTWECWRGRALLATLYRSEVPTLDRLKLWPSSSLKKRWQNPNNA